MRHIKNKLLVLLLGIISPTVWCGANVITQFDGYSHIIIKEGILQGFPKGSTINATISGHLLTVSFTQNIGQVEVEITTDTGATVDCVNTSTPTGFQCYILDAGDYVVTFTLSNGDEYYGEFTVTD
ncbi:MAG: DUF3244 domain-containing protein [Bacteroidales bacterium]|nr:DUF3244 domain-containing protein [Bacteroidales bacterium]